MAEWEKPYMKFAAGTRDSVTDKPYFMKSDCGKYTVTIPFGSLTGYEAWSVKRDAHGKRLDAEIISCHSSAALAKKACEEHANA